MADRNRLRSHLTCSLFTNFVVTQYRTGVSGPQAAAVVQYSLHPFPLRADCVFLAVVSFTICGGASHEL